MENEDLMFDEHSFQDELTDEREVHAAYTYFTHNLTAFRQHMAEKGYEYQAIEDLVKVCWTHIIQAGERVGYMNNHMQRMADFYHITASKN